MFLIHFLHQATTALSTHRNTVCCSLFIFYIKPQLPALQPVIHIGCSLFIFYIKPQLFDTATVAKKSCSLFIFYIKPQQRRCNSCQQLVVPYSFSTSSHNASAAILKYAPVVPYSFSTSSHNFPSFFIEPCLVVPYSFSTSSHNMRSFFSHQPKVVPYSFSTSSHNKTGLSYPPLPVVPYSFSTSSHNTRFSLPLRRWLFLIHFLHQATTHTKNTFSLCRCSLFIFYIKPQPTTGFFLPDFVVPYSFSTSSHNIVTNP